MLTVGTAFPENHMKKLLLSFLLFAIAASTAIAQSISAEAAEQVFQAAQRVNTRDGGKLWGMPVCGPIFLADPQTRDVVANQSDAEGLLRKSGSAWAGKLPESITPANSATDFGGVHWTMLVWPVTEDPRDRDRLVAHECFHRIQRALKLEPQDAVAGHLDDKVGRIWLQLEWRALERALATTGEERRSAIADAIHFRNYRRAVLKSAAATENALEMNEGLAEYTGYRLANPNEADRRAAAIYNLHAGAQKQSFGRSFAYVSGPAYGILLDASGAEWRKKLTPATDWAVLLAAAYKLALMGSNSIPPMQAANDYQGETLIAAETQRAVRLEVKRAEVRDKFVNGPVLVLPIDDEFGYGFNPNDTLSLDENSTLYGWARITGSWGVLESNNGVLMTRRDGKIVRVVVPAAKTTESPTSDDWKLTLKPGWKIVVDGKNQTLEKE